MFLAIDPGLDTGYALFCETGELNSCGVGFPSDKLRTVTRAIIERPQVYQARLSKGDPNDLITLAIQVGRYAEKIEAFGARVGFVLPTTWKGQVPKDIHHARIFASLAPGESATVARCGSGVTPSKRHNMMDAVGLGKWAFRTKAW